MRIVLDCERMRYPNTGIFEYCRQLGIALKSVKEPEDKISYYLNHESQKYFDIHDHFLNQKRFHKFIFPAFKNIDLWHTTYQLSSYIPKKKNIKRVLTIHDLNFLHENTSPHLINKKMLQHQQNIDLADHIVAISSFVKNDIITHLDLNNKPITVIYNGCADAPFLSKIKPAHFQGSPFLFALGTVNPKKNFHVLIPLLADNSYELIIAGKIELDYKDKILKEAAKYQVADRVRIIGEVSENDKFWYYKNCEAFLFPSIAEGFGIPPIEAMKLGKPTFLANTTSLPEIGGKHAYYFNDFEPSSMQKIFNDGMKDYQLKHPANDIVKHAKQFNWENSAKAYLDVYRKTLDG